MKPPRPLMLWSLIIDILVVGAVIWGLLFLCESRSWPLRILAAVPVGAAGIVALDQIYHAANTALSAIAGARSTLVLRIAVAIAIFLLLIRSPRRLRAGLQVLFLLLCPLFFVYAAQGFWLYEVADANIGPGKAAGMLPASSSHNRVIWIIFDEMDYRLSFPARPARIQLPHFDALRRISVFADHVKSPAHNTIAAMPSLLLAKDIPRDEDVDIKPRPIQVRFSGCSHFVSISSQPNVFRQARKHGFNTAVSGWYHPYCRDFGSDLSACASIYGFRNATGVQTFLRAKPLWETAIYLANWQARANRFAYQDNRSKERERLANSLDTGASFYEPPNPHRKAPLGNATWSAHVAEPKLESCFAPLFYSPSTRYLGYEEGNIYYEPSIQLHRQPCACRSCSGQNPPSTGDNGRLG